LVVDDILEVPTITLCFDLSQVVKWEEMSHEERVSVLQNSSPFLPGTENNILPDYDVMKENGTQETKRIPGLVIKGLNNFFVGLVITANLQKMNLSRLFEVTKEYSELFSDVFMFLTYFETGMPIQPIVEETYSSMTVGGNFEKVIDVRTFLKDSMKCFAMDIKQEHRKVNFYTVMRQPVIPGMLSLYRVKKDLYNVTSIINYVLTPNKRTMRSGFYSYISLAPDHGLSFAMTYETLEAHLLPPPFETNCVNYRSHGRLVSRGDCYEECVRKEMLDINGLVTQGVNIFSNETGNLLGLVNIMFNATTKKMLEKINILCDELCHAKDCVSINHIPRKLTTFRSPDGPFIANISPQSPTVRASCQKMLTLTQYLTEMVSTFGFWLGVSAFGIFRFAKKSGKAIKEAYKKPQKIEQENIVERPEPPPTPEGCKRYGSEYGVVQSSRRQKSTVKHNLTMTNNTYRSLTSRVPLN
jgi:hypothetical protein